MGFRIQKSLIYKYVSYRFKRECLNEPSPDCMSPSEKEGLCVAVAKKTSWIFLVFGVYIAVLSFGSPIIYGCFKNKAPLPSGL